MSTTKWHAVGLSHIGTTVREDNQAWTNAAVRRHLRDTWKIPTWNTLALSRFLAQHHAGFNVASEGEGWRFWKE